MIFKFNPLNCTDEIFCNLLFLNIGMVCKWSNGIYQPCSVFSADSCIVNEIHALAFSCNTAFLNHSQFCTSTTNKKTQTITAVKEAREENQLCEDVDSFSLTFYIDFWHLVSTGIYLD